MKRKPLPDLLKGLAVILMVQVHIMELFMNPAILDSPVGRVSLFLGGIPAAPLFMAVMGYFAGRSSKGPAGHAIRGLRLIFLGLVLNIGLNAHLILRVLQGRLDVNPLHYIFGADILFLAGISLLLIALLIRVAGKNPALSVLLTFAIPAMAGLAKHFNVAGGFWEYLMAFIISRAEWSYFPFIPWAGWVMAGFSLALLEEKYVGWFEKRKSFLIYAILAAGVPVVMFIPWASGITSDLPAYYHHGFPFFIWGLLFLALWAALGRLLQSYFGRTWLLAYIRWLGRNVTLAYMMQWLIIGNMATAIYQSQAAFMFPVHFVSVLLGTTIIVWLAVRLRKG